MEDRRANGRVERVIRTIRDGFFKLGNGMAFDDKSRKIVIAYNKTYHVGIKCTPYEVLKEAKYEAVVQNSKRGPYSRRFKEMGNKIELKKGEKVRIAQNENIKGKQVKSRFIQKTKILEKCNDRSYVVQKTMEESKRNT